MRRVSAFRGDVGATAAREQEHSGMPQTREAQRQRVPDLGRSLVVAVAKSSNSADLPR
jgi:hypothetical protein